MALELNREQQAFHEAIESNVQLFQAQRDVVFRLLGSSYNYQSGIHREALVREYLRKVVPRGIGVDTGFIYGFNKVKTSGQIDIVIWDMRHPPVFSSSEFVVVPPEAAVAVVTVKTGMKNEDLRSGIENLLSVAPIDVTFRQQWGMPPIIKLFVSFDSPRSLPSALETISDACVQMFASDGQMASAVLPTLTDIDPTNPSQAHADDIERLLPKYFGAVDQAGVSLWQGWGPPDDEFGTKTHGPSRLRRIPWIYRQKNELTSSLAKVTYYILYQAYRALGITPGAFLMALIELDPVHGYRVGDTLELNEAESARLLDPDKIAPAPATATPMDD